MSVPVAPEGHAARDPSDDFIEEEADRARVITMALAGTPEWLLPLHCRNHFAMGEEVGPIFRRESRKPRLMRDELGEGQVPLAGREQLGPDLGDGIVGREPGILKGEKKGDRGRSFCRGPDRGQRIGSPGDLFPGISPSVMERDDFSAVFPDREGGAEFAALFEIPVETFFEGSDHGLRAPRRWPRDPDRQGPARDSGDPFRWTASAK